MMINGKEVRIDVGANLRGANLEGANLKYANLKYVNLECANLKYANLECAHLEYAHLEDANLRGANLEDANLKYVHLEYANLRDANLKYANLRSAHLEDASLKDAQYALISMFQINWGNLSDELTLELMRHDAESCGEEAMNNWAKTDKYPFPNNLEKDFYFQEKKELWQAGVPKLRGMQLFKALCEEKNIQISY